jgi:hypothetical protein
MPIPNARNEHQKLGELPGASSRDKIEVWTATDEDGSAALELVEYSWGSGIGWYVQKRVRLDAGQVEALKALLGTGLPAPPPPKRAVPPVVRHGNIIQLQFPG